MRKCSLLLFAIYYSHRGLLSLFLSFILFFEKAFATGIIQPVRDNYSRRIGYQRNSDGKVKICLSAKKGEITFITSFNAGWYIKMTSTNSQSKNKLERTVLEFVETLHRPLVVYHEDELPEIRGVCTMNMNRLFPWLQYELNDPTSGLNLYYKVSTFEDFANRRPLNGSIKMGHVLMLKVAAIHHAVTHSTQNSLVFWVDTDITFRKPLSDAVIRWLLRKDITYIPFFSEYITGGCFPGITQNVWDNFNPFNRSSQVLMLREEWWKVESGLVALTVTDKTRRLTKKALDLYRGEMYYLALQCFRKSVSCERMRVKTNVFLNDIFAFTLLLQSDVHDDLLFSVQLSHGWFAMRGLSPWGQNRAVWGNTMYRPNFVPISEPDGLITNFHIGEYVFHHFAYHEKGAIAVQLKSRGNNDSSDSWRWIKDVGNLSKSLMKFIITV